MSAAEVIPLRNEDPFRNNGTPWLPTDYEKLMNMYEAGKRWGEIAYALGRTVPACVNQLRAIRRFAKLPKKIWRPRPLYKINKFQLVGRK